MARGARRAVLPAAAAIACAWFTACGGADEAGDRDTTSPSDPSAPPSTTGPAPATATTVPAVEVGREWEVLDTGDVFEGAVVTDATAGPGGYVAVGTTTEEDRSVVVWHSADGVSWERVEGDLGLPEGLVAGPSDAGLAGFPEGAVDDRPVVVAAGPDGYVLAAQRAPFAEPPEDVCHRRAYLADSEDGLAWEPVGEIDLGLQHFTFPGCGLPPEGSARVATNGQLTTLVEAGNLLVAAGANSWSAQYDTGSTAAAVWSGPAAAVPPFVSSDAPPWAGPSFRGVVDGAAVGDTLVLAGFADEPGRAITLVSTDGVGWELVDPATAEEGVDIGFSAVAAAPDGGLVAVGVAEPPFTVEGEPALRVWRSGDGREWTPEQVDDPAGVTIGDVAAASWGAVAVGTTGGVLADFVAFYTAGGGSWRRVDPGDPSFNPPVRALATEWGVVVFSVFPPITQVLVSGNAPAGS